MFYSSVYSVSTLLGLGSPEHETPSDSDAPGALAAASADTRKGAEPRQEDSLDGFVVLHPTIINSAELKGPSTVCGRAHGDGGRPGVGVLEGDWHGLVEKSQFLGDLRQPPGDPWAVVV